MSVIFILIIFATRSAAICLPLLNLRDSNKANNYPERIWKWNQNSKEFDLLEALKNNSTLLCKVNYIEDLSGKTIIASGPPFHPYLIFNTDDTLTGYIGDIWTTLEETLKFRTVFIHTRSTAVQAFERGQADVWLAPMTFHYYTTGYYTYSHQVTTTYYGLYILSEGTRVSKWWYTSIFSPGLWAMSFSFIVGITGFLLGMYRFKRAVCRNYVECNDELAIPSFNFLSVLGVIIGQGFQKFPTSWSLRVLIISGVIMGMLVSCGFSSTLTSYLAIRGNFLPLNSLQDIVQKRTHSLCLRDHGVTWHWLKDFLKIDSTSAPEWKSLVNVRCPNMSIPSEFKSNICQSGFVYLEATDAFLSIYRQVQHRCHIVPIPWNNWSSEFAFLHARSSAYRRVINKYLLRLRTAGILNYLERKWMSRETPNSNNHQWGFQPVEYAHIDRLSVGLLIMTIVSAIICILENIWFRFQMRIRTKNRFQHLNNFPKARYDFPANALDSATRNYWALNI